MGIRETFTSNSPSANGRLGVSAIPTLAPRTAPWAAKSAPAPTEQKAVSYPAHLFWGPGAVDRYISPDDLTGSGARAYAVAALAYICIRLRAQKVREAPLMIVEEGDSGETWLKNHPLNPLLARPNPDYGMARLMEATETLLLSTGGRCLWVKNRDRSGRVASLYPFGGDEFTVEKANGRLFGRFKVSGHGKWLAPEDVVYFAYFDPTDPLGGVSPLDAAMSHLGIAHALQARIRHFVRNSAAPGGIYVADKDWKPGKDEFDEFKQEINLAFSGARTGQVGFAMGGGKFERGWSLQDLALGELWREAEAIVCACFGVPASLVGTVVGLENSPWSHMSTAHKLLYDQAIIPEWTFLAETITEGLVREADADPSHVARFDTSRVRALQVDQAQQALVASTAQRWTSVNERRQMMGLPKLEDPKADAIPELTDPTFPALPRPAADDDAEDEGKARRGRPSVSARFLLTDQLLEQHADVWELAAASLLERDREQLATLVSRVPGAKETAPVRIRERVWTALEAYLDGDSQDSWRAASRPLIQQTADAAVYATVVPDTGIAYRLLRPHLGSYVEREAAFLVTSVTDTTKQAIREALKAGFDEGEGVDGIARRIRGMTQFDRTRARLIARTETTRTFTGAPLEALTQYAETTGSSFTKRWLATMDDRVRDEHAAMHGETVPIDKPFSNGLTHPSEPNCRCGLTYGLAGVDL